VHPLHAPDAAEAGPYLILFLACLPALDMESEAGARQVVQLGDAGGRGDLGAQVEISPPPGTQPLLRRGSDVAMLMLAASWNSVLT
jgi:hypothetical protein